MDVLANKSSTKQDEQAYRAWFEYADAGLQLPFLRRMLLTLLAAS
jgi:hypothetical protein